MLVPKSKRLPYPQLVWWNEWFANYSFIVKHVKGKDNIVPDYLTRPTYKKPSEPIIFYTHPLHIYTMSSTNPLPPGITDLPLEFPSLFSTLLIDEIDIFRNLLFSYQTQAIQDTGPYIVGSLDITSGSGKLNICNFLTCCWK